MQLAMLLCPKGQSVSQWFSLKSNKQIPHFLSEYDARKSTLQLRGLFVEHPSSLFISHCMINCRRKSVSSYAWQVVTAVYGDELSPSASAPKIEAEQNLREEKQTVEGASMGKESCLSTEDLRVGSIYKGKVTSIESYGAFVDIGAYTNGLIHISRLNRAFVENVEDILHVGQEVTTQIIELDLPANRLSLMLKPDWDFNQNMGMGPLTISEMHVMEKAAQRRANLSAGRTINGLPRRQVSLENRMRMKAIRRAAIAERLAKEQEEARLKARDSNQGAAFKNVGTEYTAEGWYKQDGQGGPDQ